MARRIAWLMVVAALVASAGGCAAEPSPPSPVASVTAGLPDEVFFPRTRPMNAYPSALMEGVLRLHGRCLVVGTQLLLWPPDWRPLDRGDGTLVVMDGTGAIMATVGEVASFGGGEYGAELEPFVRELLGALAIPPECQRARFWLVAPEWPNVRSKRG